MASVLARALKPIFPSVTAYGYGMPNCVLDPESALESKDYVLSFATADDVIPNSSIESMLQIREDFLEAAGRSKVRKVSCMMRLWSGKSIPVHDKDRYLYPSVKDACPETQAYVQRHSYPEHLRRMVPEHFSYRGPGSLFIIHPTSTTPHTRWLGRRPNEFTLGRGTWDDHQEISFSRRMFIDHCPFVYERELYAAYRKASRLEQARQ